MLEHGGRLRAAAQRYGIPLADWIDLSTGIAPWPYPLPAPPAEVWQRLPEDDDGLLAAAHAYYGSANLLALPGSQAGIQLLPRLLPPARVAMPAPIYNEHPAAWQAAGHQVVAWGTAADYALLCNPNNPTGACFTRDELIEQARRVRWLIVDEAFIDADPGESMIGCAAENVLVLRSLGKFFGLAGARVGFVSAPLAIRSALVAQIGPWALAHPARWAAQQALVDRDWQAAQRQRSHAAAQRLAELLRTTGLGIPTGTVLFQYLPTPRADEFQEALARQGILVRAFDQPAALRFGLPGNETAWQRLATALEEMS